jgi:phosphotriesterase-related protein
VSFVRTVLGDIEDAQLGVCYAHEHIIIDPSFTTLQTSEFLLDDVQRAATELGRFHADGGRAMVDSMPCDCGRNVCKLAEVSRRSGVHIVAPTGLHLAKYYDPGHWGNSYSEDQLADLLVAEIEEGIDAHDYSGPIVMRTLSRAGVIKIATGPAWTRREEKLFAAAAQAHRRTGCPILTHTERGELGLEQIDRLARLGVDLTHVCLSHTDRKADLGYHRAMLQTGVRLEYDGAFRWKPEQGNPTLDLVIGLVDDFPDQLMLGMDAARRGYWRSYGGDPGLSFLLTTFSEQLFARGLTQVQWQRVFLSTPAHTYAFASTIVNGPESLRG